MPKLDYVPADPMEGCPQCKWADSSYGSHLIELCEVHRRMEDLQESLGMYQSVSRDSSLQLAQIADALRVEPDSDLVAAAKMRMEDLDALESV